MFATVMPTLWQALPVYLLVAGLPAALVYGLHRLRLRTARRQTAQLQALVAQRSQELHALQQEAIAAAATRTVVLANMGHGIRTPMNAIIGLAHLMQNTDLSPRQQDHVRKIERSGRHLLDVFNDILDFSKLESGQLSIVCIPFALDRMLQEVVDMVAPLAADKGLEFICVSDPQVPRDLLGDPMRLTQILINFLQQAIRQTVSGEILLQVQACALPDAAPAQTGPCLRFTVQDSGQDLSAQQCTQLFEDYLQPDSSLQRHFGARSLGLAVGKRLAERMGGAAGASSVAGRGCSLWFTAVLQTDPSPPPAAALQGGVQGLRALVVDDHPVAARTLCDLLNRLGLMADVCHSGREALECLRQAEHGAQAYHFVLLDWDMPDWDGPQSARAIGAAGLLQTPHIIILTGHSKDAVAKSARAQGLHDILTKPVTRSVLSETLMRLSHAADGYNTHDPAARAPCMAHAAGDAAV